MKNMIPRKKAGVFTENVYAFLKVKQENPGYPSWCENDYDKGKYIEEYERNEGIRLEKDKICYNEGLRSISKLLLKSFWGRYCLQRNKIKYSMISPLKELYDFLLNDLYELHDVQFILFRERRTSFRRKGFKCCSRSICNMVWAHETISGTI
jgi:hypothetical protein